MVTSAKPHNYCKIGKNLWMLLVLVSIAAGAAAQDISIRDSMMALTTTNSPASVIQKLDVSTAHFIKAAGKNFGMVGSEYHYLLLKLQTTGTPAQQYLSVDNTSLDTVSIFKIGHAGKSLLLYQGGALVPFKNHSHYVWHTCPVEISSDPSYYLIALKAAQKNINVKYEVMDQVTLQRKYQAHDRLIFFYMGIVFLILVITALAFLLFKKGVFAAYAGYILFATTWILSHYGYVFPYVYPQVPVINEILKPVSSLGACFFLIIVLNLVFSQQLQSREWLLQLMKAMLLILSLLTASMFLLLLPGLHFRVKTILIVAWHTGLIFSIGLIAFTPFSFFESGATAKIFSTAMLVICTMTLVQLLANSGYINNFFIEEHGITVGSVSENTIIALGLFFNLLQERKQREKQVLSLEQEQTETLKKLVTVQDNERKRIAADLHDNIGPLLAALKINFRRIIHTKEEGLQEGLVNKTESIIDDTIAEIRNVAHNLMPKGLSANGLVNTLNDYFESLRQLYDKEIVFHHQIKSVLTPDLQINIYRIICELVLNSGRHSNAYNITVRINADEHYLFVSVQDDGQGFITKMNDPKKALGLQSAESRVLYLEGKFTLQTQPGRGALVEIEIPLQLDKPQVERL